MKANRSEQGNMLLCLCLLSSCIPHVGNQVDTSDRPDIIESCSRYQCETNWLGQTAVVVAALDPLLAGME